MKNPIAEAYLKMLQEAKEKKMDPVGKADADIDNDGDVDDSDEYLHKRRKAIKKSMKEEVCDKCGKEPCECEDENDVDEACGKSKKEAVSIDPDDGEVTKAKDDKKKKKEADPETVSEAKESVEEGLEENRLLKVSKLSSAEYQKAKKLKGFDKSNYTWNSSDQLYHKKAKNESVEIKEKALTVDMDQPVKIDDTEEKGHMDAVKANKAGPGKAKENKAKKLKELRK
jgi:hypothetical protein